MPVRSGDGPPNAQIMIVGEAFGETEERVGTPFSGASGLELGRMLHDAGLTRSECYVSNLVNARPPANNLDLWIPPTKNKITKDMVLVRGKFVKPIVKEGFDSLVRELNLVKPKVVVALGNAALWALTGESGIAKWRGSLLSTTTHIGGSRRVIPTFHPAAILRQWEWRNIAVHDLRRVKRELVEGPVPSPKYEFLLQPSFEGAMGVLRVLYSRAETSPDPLWLDFDIETVVGHIRCFAITWSVTQGICIPLMKNGLGGSYWTGEEEGRIVYATYKLLTHSNVRVRGQNLLYDFQYTHKHWGFIPRLGQDSMLSHHVLWAGMPKSLAYQASMYADHYVYWKDMGHESNKTGE